MTSSRRPPSSSRTHRRTSGSGSSRSRRRTSTSTTDRSLEPAADRLYELPPGDFTAARNALAKQLRGDGRADEAARVAKLRKPDPTAWALNQVARREPKTVEAALAAAQALRTAQEEAVGGSGGGALREAMRAERDAVRELVDAALAAGRDAGVRPDPERAASTIHAANADERLREELAAGRLERWARDESLGGMPAAPKRSRSGAREGTERERRRRAELREAQRAVESAGKRHARAEEKAAKARRELAGLEEAERAAAEELAEAERRLEKLA